MAHSRVAEYRRWFEYEKDSHRKVMDSFESVPRDQRSSPSFHKALDIMGHIVAARRMWLFRLGVTAERPDQLFPSGTTLDGVADHLKIMEQSWTGDLESLNDEKLEEAFEYQSLDAGRCRSVLGDILTQLFGHSWYHRGQIASLVKAAGGQPAITDFIYWSREPISTSAS
jgi:uncharacterized damage-inducible protein DinB